MYVPGLVAPMLPHELADDALLAPAAPGPAVRDGRDRPRRRAELLPVRHPQPGAVHVRAGAARSSRAASSTSWPTTSGWPTASPAELRRRRFARGALRVESPEVNFAFDGQGGVERAWLEAEPTAHALIEELMILANEAVAAFLAGRRAESLYRVHEPPEPQSVAHLLAKLADLEVPTPPAPRTRA